MLNLSLNHKLQLASALLCLTSGSAGQAVADVTIDACVTENSISHPLASDMQILCGVSSSVGQLIGFTISGFLVHLIGSKERCCRNLLNRMLHTGRLVKSSWMLDHVGTLVASSVGGLLLHSLKVSRTQFDNLWIAIIIRAISRVLPIGFLFLVPNSDPNASILPNEMLKTKKGDDDLNTRKVEMAPLVTNVDQDLVDSPVQ